MTNDSNKVVAGSPKVGGAIFRAPVGTALPTNETTTLNVAFKNQGYAHADGLKRTIDKAYETIRAWGGDIVKKNRTELTITLDFTLIQAADSDVVTSLWGASAVTVTSATSTTGTKIALAYKGEEVANSSWVIELADGGNIRRIVCPNAQLATESFEQEFSDGSTINYPVQLTLAKDSSGVYFYEYSDDGIKSA